MELTLIHDQEKALTLVATRAGYENAQVYMQAQLDTRAAEGQAILDGEATAAYLAKRDAYDKADGKTTKAEIEAAASAEAAAGEVNT
jgi:hypothetical protein